MRISWAGEWGKCVTSECASSAEEEEAADGIHFRRLPPSLGRFPPLMSVFRVGGGGGNAVNWVMSLAFPHTRSTKIIRRKFGAKILLKKGAKGHFFRPCFLCCKFRQSFLCNFFTNIKGGMWISQQGDFERTRKV